MPNSGYCSVCGDHCIVKCSKCQTQGYLLRNEGETIASGEDIVICAQCKGTGAEACPTCSRTSLPDG